MFARPSRNIYNTKRTIAIQGYYMNMIELLGENGEIPPAWYGMYAWMALVKSAALFGDGQKEEGYDLLEAAIDYLGRNSVHKPGDPLDVGGKEMLGGIKYLFNKGVILLPDGSKEPIAHAYSMIYTIDNLYYSITAPKGWEWFNPVRNEDRFKEYIERARKLRDKK